MRRLMKNGKVRHYSKKTTYNDSYHPIGRRMVSREKQFELFCRQLENFADKIREWHDRLKENAK